jgi:hypothetical protein
MDKKHKNKCNCRTKKSECKHTTECESSSSDSSSVIPITFTSKLKSTSTSKHKKCCVKYPKCAPIYYPNNCIGLFPPSCPPPYPPPYPPPCPKPCPSKSMCEPHYTTNCTIRTTSTTLSVTSPTINLFSMDVSGCVVTLPEISILESCCFKKMFVITNIGTHSFTIVPTGTNTIIYQTSPSPLILVQNQTVTLYSIKTNGGNYWIMTNGNNCCIVT